jgi:hypothetical protein
MMFKARYLGKAVIAIVAVAVLGGVVMFLWNAVLPVALAGAHSIDYLHALGLLILSRILFGGFRGGRGGWRGRHWAKWQAMTPEEREQFRQNMPMGRRSCARE